MNIYNNQLDNDGYDKGEVGTMMITTTPTTAKMMRMMLKRR